MKDGYLSTNIAINDIQRALYIYFLCKEQRNKANHADDKIDNILLDSEQIKKLILSFLESIGYNYSN